MGEYTKWCDSEANEKEDAITSAARTISELQATIEESSGLQRAVNATRSTFFGPKVGQRLALFGQIEI